MNWAHFLQDLPIVAILRGLTPNDAVAIAAALHQGQISCLETPLNSPDPLKSIAAIREAFDGKLLVGAGTVLTPDQVREAKAAGAHFIVSPNTDPAVIEATKACGLFSMPGFFTPTEALLGLRAGADALKLFPAEATHPDHLKALKAVLPADAPVFAVGGVSGATMSAWIEAGAAGFGVGSALYRPGDQPDLVRSRAVDLVAAYRQARR